MFFLLIVSIHQLTQQNFLPCPLQVPSPSCFDCQTETGNLHMCLQCVYTGCRKSGHLKSHFLQTGHVLGPYRNLSSRADNFTFSSAFLIYFICRQCVAVDMVTDEIYCAKCNNYVFDATLGAISAEERHNAHNYRVAVAGQKESAARVADWNPTAEELSILQNQSVPVVIPTHLLGTLRFGSFCRRCDSYASTAFQASEDSTTLEQRAL